MKSRCTNCEAAAFLTMSGASLGGLDPAGWNCREEGEIRNGELQCKEEEEEGALFKHSQSLEAEDFLRMKVVAGFGACVGIAAEGYDVERDEETYKSTAYVKLSTGRRLTTRRVLVLVLQQMGRRTILFNPRKRRRGSLSQSLPQSLSPSVGSTPSSTGLVASCSRGKRRAGRPPLHWPIAR